MAVIRLWERDGEVSVLERSDAELARARRVGGSVYDVTCERPVRADAEELLKRSRLVVSPFSDEAGAVARAQRAVVMVQAAQTSPGS